MEPRSTVVSVLKAIEIIALRLMSLIQASCSTCSIALLPALAGRSRFRLPRAGAIGEIQIELMPLVARRQIVTQWISGPHPHRRQGVCHNEHEILERITHGTAA